MRLGSLFTVVVVVYRKHRSTKSWDVFVYVEALSTFKFMKIVCRKMTRRNGPLNSCFPSRFKWQQDRDQTCDDKQRARYIDRYWSRQVGI